MGKINILGLGPGDANFLTLGVINEINSGNKNFLRTKKHPTIKYFDDNSIEYESYDYVYDREAEFEDVYEYIVEDLINKAEKYKVINYLVPGNPLVAEKTVELLLDKENEELEIELMTGMSFIEPVIQLMKRDPINGLKIVDGITFDINDININIDFIITQVYNRRVASNIKLVLSEVYGDDYKVYLINSAGVKGKETLREIPIYKLDRIDTIDSLFSIYVTKMDKITKNIYNIDDIIYTMKKLRSDTGCPWDRQQTHESIRQCVIEEAYEVVDAIDRGDIDSVVEELGDLLFQVIFHCQIAQENGEFNLYNVTTELNKKLIYRHPHVFDEKKVEKSDEVVYNWDKLKFKSKGISTYSEMLNDIPKLPSLMRSSKVQERAARIGFDWDSTDGALDKIKEEYYEVVKEINTFKGGDIGKIEEESGDLLFAVVNLCRFLDVNPEIALNKTVNKFISRFEFMEKKSKEIGKTLEEMTLEEMDVLWNEAKLHRH
ncbi:nucleoside triphosphate pyrophosphohydrolase [Schnuerera sp. xch1]|uniref:nucleoside triphosphate pyrophosphohydrolase n=1 Tax=Schnuerera sp. xch1 TaxID=2874283 RepID=UPI001CBC1984|nr:nucleoside triphosphate pyrophosphohydrolase [Schnuerera sp. xch1]